MSKKNLYILVGDMFFKIGKSYSRVYDKTSKGMIWFYKTNKKRVKAIRRIASRFNDYYFYGTDLEFDLFFEKAVLCFDDKNKLKKCYYKL